MPSFVKIPDFRARLSMTPSPDILLSSRDDSGILRLTLNDAARRNALSNAMLDRLGAALQSADNDPSIRVVILSANGPAFCAGHDLKEMAAARDADDRGRAFFGQVMKSCSTVMQNVVTCSKPIIAEIDGIATAAGCQLVASCDLAIASDTSKFSTPGVHIGLFCSTPMVALSRNVSNKHAMEMLLTGDMIPAPRACEFGLINRAVPASELSEATSEMALKIASKSSMTIATGKRAFYEQREMTLADAYNHASNVMVENMLAHDASEGIDAFIQKRKPNWQDK
jgi:enoyl-CoA hydratase/carnithine racemase